jgi:diguanylate cyclase (GGDEF)-like protein
MRLLLPLLLAAALTAHADDSARTLLVRGDAHENAGRLAEAERDYSAARVAAERGGQRTELIDALAALGYLQYYRGETNESLVNLQRGHDLARAAGDEARQRKLLEAIAHVYADSKVAQYDRAIEYYLQLLPQFERAGDGEHVADTLYNLGSTFERKEDLASALEWYRRALAAEEKLGRAEEMAFVKRSIGATLGKMGRYAEGLAMLDDSLRTYAAKNDRESAMRVRQSRGIVYRRAGNLPAAIADLEATREWFAKENNTRFLEKTEEELALAYASAGRWHDAYDARTRHAALQRELAEKLREEHTSRMRVQFDSERKESENRALLRDNAAAASIRRLQTIILLLGAAIIVVLVYLMKRLSRDKRRMREMAMTDELTRLPNRRHLLAAAEEQLRHARTTHAPFALIAFDIDYFKRINDTWGHAAGDLVLQRVAHACRTALRPGDQIGRTGGEEFMVVLPSTDEASAVAVAERLRRAVETVGFHDIDPTLRVTISLGVAARTFEDSLAKLTGIADELLYRAKELGRNRVVAGGSLVA